MGYLCTLALYLHFSHTGEDDFIPPIALDVFLDKGSLAIDVILGAIPIS